MSHPYVVTTSGNAISLSLDDPLSIRVSDVAYALGNINRFTGHCRPYSVAQHSVLVSHLCHAHDAMDGLMHDAHEILCQDVATGAKTAMRNRDAVSDYDTFEDRCAYRMRKCFRVNTVVPASVAAADRQALEMEVGELFSQYAIATFETLGVTTQPLPEHLTYIVQARVLPSQLFLNRYLELNAHSHRRSWQVW